MNRRGRASFSLSTILALATLALLISCGGGGGGTTDTGTTPPPDDTTDAASTADTQVPLDGSDQETAPPDDIPVVDCTTTGCADAFADLNACETAECNTESGQCERKRATAAPECCVDASECDDQDAMTADTCPVPGEACVHTDITCVDDPTICDDAFPDATACQTAACNEDTKACELATSDPPDCCLEDAECDDADDNTADSCPTPGEACHNDWICTVDEDCADAFDDLNACETATCDADAGTCQRDRNPAPACCVNAAECVDTDPNTTDTCPAPGGPCSNVSESCGDQADPDQCCFNQIGPADVCETIAWDAAAAECKRESNRGEFCCITRADCPPAEGWYCPEVGARCIIDIVCLDEVTPLRADFDTGTLEEFEVIDYNESDSVTWNVVEENAYAGSAIYLGDPRCGWYFNGDQVDEDCQTPYDPAQDFDPFNPGESHASAVSVELVSPLVALPEEVAFALGFWIAGESEPPIPGLPDEFQPDTLVVSIEDTNTGFQDVVFRTSSYDNVILQPTFVAADITQYAGRAVRIHFNFDTLDGNANRFPGWWLDGITIRSICGSVVCEQNADCRDSNGCTVDTCTPFENADNGMCALNVVPADCAPCRVDDDCVTEDACTLGSCIPQGQPGEFTCAWAASGSPECCDANDLIEASFDGGTLPAGWSIEDDGSDVKWQVWSDPDAGRTTLYFGDPATMSYGNGAHVEGRVSTGAVALPDPAVTPFVSLVTTWELNLSTEFDDEAWDPNVPVDRLSLFVAYLDEDGLPVEDEVWNSTAVEGTTMGEWVAVGADLTEYAGRTVELIFQFDSDDELSNDYGGAWIDSFSLRTSCDVPCSDEGDCDDGEVCTVDACVAGTTCAHTLAYADCCASAADCGASDACTDVTCSEIGAMGVEGAGVCTYRDDNDDTTCCDDDGGVTFENTIPIQDLEAGDYVITQGSHGDALNTVVWQASDLCMLSPPYGLYFGDPDFGSYQSGYPVSGTVTTPQFKLPSSGPAAKTWLEFGLFLDTEWRGAQFEGWVNPPALERDKLTLYVVRGAQEIEVWNSFALDFRGSTCAPNEECAWETVRVDMTNYQTYSLKLKFAFESSDDLDNGGLGACIDDIRIVTDCVGQAEIDCLASEDCDDDDPCTWDFCQDDLSCFFPPTGDPECCTVETVSEFGWDSGTSAGWSFSAAIGSVGWQVADFTDAHTGGFFLYFGDPAAQSYDVPGQQVSGAATSEPIQLPDSDAMTVTFAYYLDIEPPSATFPNRDKFEVRVISNFSGAERVLAAKATLPAQNIGAQPPQWFTFTGNIPPEFSGDNVVFEISFNSDDAEENTGLGVLIDSFRIDAEICP